MKRGAPERGEDLFLVGSPSDGQLLLSVRNGDGEEIWAVITESSPLLLMTSKPCRYVVDCLQRNASLSTLVM